MYDYGPALPERPTEEVTLAERMAAVREYPPATSCLHTQVSTQGKGNKVAANMRRRGEWWAAMSRVRGTLAYHSLSST